MNATEELRHLLSERDVEWVDTGDGWTFIPTQTAINVAWDVNRWPSSKDVGNCLGVQNRYPLTSEQVIAATLGEECEQVLVDCDDGLLPPFKAYCSKCGTEWGYTPKHCPNCGRKVKQWTAKSAEMTASN